MTATTGARFLTEARRVGRELLIVDAARRPGVPAARWDPRVLSDGSRHRVFKRWFMLDELLAELGGDGAVVHAGTWFLAVRGRGGGRRPGGTIRP